MLVRGNEWQTTVCYTLSWVERERGAGLDSCL